MIMILMNTEKKFHLSVTLAPLAIDFINGLGGKSFSDTLQSVVMAYKAKLPDHARAEALEQLRQSIKVLKEHAPSEAIRSWVREALREVK